MGGVHKLGAGTLVLSGINTFGGESVVQAGTLRLEPTAWNVLTNIGGLDVRDGRLEFDTNGLPPAPDVRAALLSGKIHSTTGSSTMGFAL